MSYKAVRNSLADVRPQIGTLSSVTENLLAEFYIQRPGNVLIQCSLSTTSPVNLTFYCSLGGVMFAENISSFNGGFTLSVTEPTPVEITCNTSNTTIAEGIVSLMYL